MSPRWHLCRTPDTGLALPGECWRPGSRNVPLCGISPRARPPRRDTPAPSHHRGNLLLRRQARPIHRARLLLREGRISRRPIRTRARVCVVASVRATVRPEEARLAAGVSGPRENRRLGRPSSSRRRRAVNQAALHKTMPWADILSLRDRAERYIFSGPYALRPEALGPRCGRWADHRFVVACHRPPVDGRRIADSLVARDARRCWQRPFLMALLLAHRYVWRLTTPL